ncbi:MAG: hypothetical protein GXY74_13120 [Phycisphaerae bacterium]|nr:hypothetical protein [Phycisphaerae bacterium]
MRILTTLLMALVSVGVWSGCAAAQEKLEPIQKVEIGDNCELRVNGKPFLPIAVWLQDPKNFPAVREANINVVGGYYWSKDEDSGLGGTKSVSEYGAKVWEAGFYFVASHMVDHLGSADDLKALPGLLAWIHDDEPDLPRTETDANVAPGKQMKVNAGTPFARIVDGVNHSWTVLQPLAGGEFTIVPKEPVTVVSLAVWPTISEGLAVAKEMEFLGDGKLLLKVTLENKKGQQKFSLPEPATFKELTVKVLSEYPGAQGWGSISEVEGFDAEGRNLLLSKPRTVPKMTVEEVARDYQLIKQTDPSRPVMMNLTAKFMKERQEYADEAKQAMYPGYIAHCDLVGFDIYPVYGYNMPNKIYWVADGVTELRALAGPKKPVYAWIETNRGSPWIKDYSKQIDVRPEYTRAEVWMALIRGATGIAYFTHAWQPEYTQFAPKGEMLKELARLNAQLTRLAPAILAPAAKAKVAMTLSDDMACHVKATELDGALYIFAQNIDLGADAAKMKQGQDITPRGGKATITVEGLKAGATIEVVDEGRTITADDGSFSDEFKPLAEHVYKMVR